jgi:4-hydroxy-tetrahydrodipicolinate synthase
MAKKYIPSGVIPAVLLPFKSNLEIDKKAYRRHLRDVLAVDGVTALTVKGHSTETHALDPDEQKKLLDISLDEVGDKVPVISGVAGDGSRQAAAAARDAERAGAKCLLVLPTTVFAVGLPHPPENVLTHFRVIAEATSLPIIIFQYPMSTTFGYTTETLVRLAEEIPQIVAVKDLSSNPVLHEKNIRALHGLKRPFSVLTSHVSWLLSSLVMGADGILSGSGSVCADLLVQIWRAVQSKDLKKAQAIGERLSPIANVFYSAPSIDTHNRMKEALVLLGRQKQAYVRPPLMKLSKAEIERIRQGLIGAGLLGKAKRA